MHTTIRYILITALRDWLFVALFLAVLATIMVSRFLGGTALVENEHMAITYTAGVSRVIILTGLIVFICFHVRRAFENKEIDVIVSRPISRSAFVVSYWMGFAIVSFLLVMVVVTFLAAFFSVPTTGLLYWGGSFLMEAFLIAAFAVFAALIMRSAVSSVLLCFAAYFMFRLMGFFTYLLESPIYQQKKDTADIDFWVSRGIEIFSVIMPRLDLYAKSKWLIYGVAGDTNFYIFLPQSLFYIPLLLFMAVYDFKRKQF